MGLDIYVGSLTRYYRGDWETVVARTAREQGIGFKVIRTNPEPPEKITDPHVIRDAVDTWRLSLEAGLRQHLPCGLAWDEGQRRGECIGNRVGRSMGVCDYPCLSFGLGYKRRFRQA